MKLTKYAAPILAMALVVTSVPPPASADVNVAFGFFYSDLSPHGNWLASASVVEPAERAQDQKSKARTEAPTRANTQDSVDAKVKAARARVDEQAKLEAQARAKTIARTEKQAQAAAKAQAKAAKKAKAKNGKGVDEAQSHPKKGDRSG